MTETTTSGQPPAAPAASAADPFHLVLPSLPGYGFSGEPTEVGWDPGRVAQAWAKLMGRLGYGRYLAQGGDVGAFRAQFMKGYIAEQGQSPQTIGYPLTDSPVGLAAWMLDHDTHSYFDEVDRGGHFAACEEPQLFTDELRAAFRSLR
jgi:pimeloyl-ACP methyl ester carboxylesterase